ncbi:MAG: SRPBCC family protein [Actinobacteria bacterium]|nr:SRPBCC family protein [Actinomycetota bacterium]
MPISFQHSVNVSRGPDHVFAILDDVSRTPEWLERCTRVERLGDGLNTVGTPLRYSYRDGGRSGTMDGEITVREPDRHLAMRYRDRMMDVTVDFVVEPRETGTRPGSRLTHSIEITPRTLPAKLFAPLLRRQLPRQTVKAMERLQTLAES